MPTCDPSKKNSSLPSWGEPHKSLWIWKKNYLKEWAKAQWVYQYHGVIKLAPTNRVQNKDTKHKSLIGLQFIQNKNKNDAIQFS